MNPDKIRKQLAERITAILRDEEAAGHEVSESSWGVISYLADGKVPPESVKEKAYQYRDEKERRLNTLRKVAKTTGVEGMRMKDQLRNAKATADIAQIVASASLRDTDTIAHVLKGIEAGSAIVI